ncbi:DUF3301 domain-containing protein [Pseudomonas sp.]|uniref:DUF3301 domain-containing protein n=1 Tax=Pseudomonas sp. TaxID=306 RepID=UPI0028A961E6|nr:DUF3301 domain-containing protein [Pseudomonas sp.]
MLTLGNLAVCLLLLAVGAWFWHGHGIRERALAAVRRHCELQEVELLDGNVAFRRFGLVRDGRGQRRFARVYGFEFTVTGEQRHQGNIVMFGARPGRIEMEPHPLRTPPPAGQVIQLDEWRRRDH